MDGQQIEAALLARYGVRAGPEVAEFVAERLGAGAGPFAIYAGDARTGRAVRQVVVPAELAEAMPAASAS